MVLLFAAAGACGGDAGGKSAAVVAGKAAGPAKQGMQESGGDVVIHGIGEAYRVVPVATPGSVGGTVTLSEPPQAAAPIPTGNSGTICGATALDESIQASGNALAGVVVWLEGIRAGKAPPDERRLELESVQCKLKPRVQAAVVGSAVNILGHDKFMQHLRFVAGGDSAPRAAVLVGGGEQVIPTELPFTTPGLVLVRDPDHAWTRAYLAVFDHPYYAVTDAKGAFKIDNIPPGKYTLHAWHERAGESKQQVDLQPSGSTSAMFQLKLK